MNLKFMSKIGKDRLKSLFTKINALPNKSDFIEELEELLHQLEEYENTIERCHYKIDELNDKMGRRERYYKKLEDPRWIKRKNEVIEANKCKCYLCGSSTNLQVHHKVYVKGKEPWDYDDSDLVVLCEKCHNMVHQNEYHELYPKFI